MKTDYLQVAQWIKKFTSIPLDGHSKSNINPQMHIMACHIPSMMRKYGSIKPFSGQGLRHSDSIKYYTSCYMQVQRKIMIVLDGVTFLATTLMPQRKSLFLRQERKYCPVKRELKEATINNTEYWNRTIFTKRRTTES